MRHSVLEIALICALTSFASTLKASEATPGEMCQAALAALVGTGPSLACIEAPLGVALAANAERAGRLALLSQAGEQRFSRHFGRDAPRYALIEFDDPETLANRRAALSAVGFRPTQPWLSRAAYVQAYQDSLRRSAEARARAEKAGEAAAQAAGDAAVVKGGSQLTAFALEANEASMVPHEIGHGWYAEAFWQGYGIEARGHYGGPGPDWLDELAAVLMESGDSAEIRRGIFLTVYRGEGSGFLTGYPVEELIDLPHFLSRVHPAHGGGNEAQAEASRTGAPAMRVLTGTEAQKQMANIREAALFYTQGRLFADFLIDRTGDPAVFGEIGEAFARNEAFATWLETNGESRGLATTLPDLDLQWRAWLEARFGRAGGPPPVR